MKRRRSSAEVLPARAGKPTVRAVPFEGVAPLVTLDDPNAPPERALGAFARLRAPAGTSAAESDAWRRLVAEKAVAVRLVPAPRPRLAAPAVDARAKAGIREEATTLAREAGDPELAALVERLLSEAERAS